MTRDGRIVALKALTRDRTPVLDGSWGACLNSLRPDEGDFGRGQFESHAQPLKGEFAVLNLTHPDLMTKVYDHRFSGGADIAETNTFDATAIKQSDHCLASEVQEMNFAAARLARAAADRWTDAQPDKPRFVAGSMGAFRAEANGSSARSHSFEAVHAAYRQQALALHEGGVDLFLVETVFDTLNAKAALKAILDLEDEGLKPLPIWVPRARTDQAVRTLSGRTVEVYWNSGNADRPVEYDASARSTQPQQFYALNRADVVDAICRVLDVREPVRLTCPPKTKDAA